MPATVHELKTHPKPFALLQSDLKKWELRLNDREYGIGDELLLKEWVPNLDTPHVGTFTGRFLHRRVDHVFDAEGYGLLPGYVILSISKL